MNKHSVIKPWGRGRSSSESFLPEDKGMLSKPVITHIQLKIQKSQSFKPHFPKKLNPVCLKNTKYF